MSHKRIELKWYVLLITFYVVIAPLVDGCGINMLKRSTFLQFFSTFNALKLFFTILILNIRNTETLIPFNLMCLNVSFGHVLTTFLLICLLVQVGKNALKAQIRGYADVIASGLMKR